MSTTSVLGLSLISTSLMAQSIYKVGLEAFPPPQKGQKQMVIEVPHSANDINKKIEIFVGKTMQTDGCNKTFLSGEFKNTPLEGWGYTYLTFTTKGDIGSTRKACRDAHPKMEFVTSSGYLTDYNGRMPIVLYIPEGYDAKYKIYQADPDFYSATEILEKKK
ncbi:ecotin family protein [Elizabethkingia argenteiflava]|nr:ecotin family protein [Elizabethkingia argenteiflava]